MKFWRALAASATLVLAACANDSGMIEQTMDPLTSVSITYSQVPMVFYRDDSGKAAFARAYLHMGPLEVNRSGTYRYYLWLGIWNTMHAPSAGISRDGFESIVVLADGEPLTLDLAGWTPTSIGASQTVYLKPVSSSADAYYEVTVDHLRLIAASSSVSIRSTGTQSRSYDLWDKQKSAKASLQAFIDNAVY